jgi:hypothetical protein
MPSALQVRRAVALSQDAAPGAQRSARHSPIRCTPPGRAVGLGLRGAARVAVTASRVALTQRRAPAVHAETRQTLPAVQAEPIAQSRSSRHSTQRICATLHTSPPAEQSRDERQATGAAQTLATQRWPGSHSASVTQSTQRIALRSHTWPGHMRDEVQGVAATQRPLAQTGVAPPQWSRRGSRRSASARGRSAARRRTCRRRRRGRRVARPQECCRPPRPRHLRAGHAARRRPCLSPRRLGAVGPPLTGHSSRETPARGRRGPPPWSARRSSSCRQLQLRRNAVRGDAHRVPIHTARFYPWPRVQATVGRASIIGRVDADFLYFRCARGKAMRRPLFC